MTTITSLSLSPWSHTYKGNSSSLLTSPAPLHRLFSAFSSNSCPSFGSDMNRALQTTLQQSRISLGPTPYCKHFVSIVPICCCVIFVSSSDSALGFWPWTLCFLAPMSIVSGKTPFHPHVQTSLQLVEKGRSGKI